MKVINDRTIVDCSQFPLKGRAYNKFIVLQIEPVAFGEYDAPQNGH